MNNQSYKAAFSAFCFTILFLLNFTILFFFNNVAEARIIIPREDIYTNPYSLHMFSNSLPYRSDVGQLFYIRYHSSRMCSRDPSKRWEFRPLPIGYGQGVCYHSLAEAFTAAEAYLDSLPNAIYDSHGFYDTYTDPNSNIHLYYYIRYLDNDNGQSSRRNRGGNCSSGNEPCQCNRENGGNPFVGNPIHVGVGNKFESGLDFISEAPEPLFYERYYNSSANRTTPIGATWSATYYQRILIRNETVVEVIRPDGSSILFNDVDGTWSADPTIVEVLEKTADSWIFRTPDNSIETYDLDGRLINITYISGMRQSLSYDADNRLIEVSDTYGRKLSFTYANGLIKTMADSANRLYTYYYDGQNNLTRVVYPDGRVLTYLYEDSVFVTALTGIIDETGNRYATFEYDGLGNATAAYHGHESVILTHRIDGVSIVRNETGGTRTVTNSNGVATIYGTVVQNGQSLITSINGPGCTSCSGSNETYQYDLATNHVLSKTKNGVTTQYGNYNANGNYAYKIEAVGTPEERRFDYTYDTRFYNKIATITESSLVAGLNKVTTLSYNGAGNLISKTVSGYEPDGSPVTRTYTYEYNGPLGQMSKADGPRDDITDAADVITFEYHPFTPDRTTFDPNNGRLVRVVSPIGTLRDNIQYTPAGKILSEDRPNGLTVTYNYNPDNDRIETLIETDTSSGASRTTRWTYLSTGEVETITRADGSSDATTITFSYDSARRLTSITDGLGNYVEYTLDTEGNRLAEKNYDNLGVLHKQLTQTFDMYNRLDISTEENQVRNFNFAADGTLNNATDGNNHVTEYDYDALNRLLTTTRDFGGAAATANTVTQYFYDVHDNLISVIDPNNNATKYHYDDMGNLLTQISPDTGTTMFSYDAAGNLRTRLDANGNNFVYTYDALNRLTILDAPGADDDIRYTYDSCINGVGRLCGVTLDGQTVSYAYSPFGDIIQHQGVQYDYDTAGQLTAMTYPSATVVHYGRDAAGQVERVELTHNGVTTILAEGIHYAPFGPMTDLYYGNGLRLRQPLDLATRIQGIDIVGTPVSLSNYQYDGNGNLVSRDNVARPETYGYDALNRLASAAGDFGAQAYRYDANGNRLERQQDDTTTAYAYTPGSNRIVAIDSVAIVLDANGNTLDDGRHQYHYNSHNRLTQVLADTQVLGDYTYNGLGQRITKTVDGVTREYHYSLDGLLIAETGGGEVLREYVYLNGQLLTVVDHVAIPPASQDVILDDKAPEVSISGTWQDKNGRRSFDKGFLLAEGNTGATMRWTPALDGGVYDLYGWWPRINKNSSTVPITIRHGSETTTLTVDQTATGKDWVLLGRYTFTGDGSEYVEMSDAAGPAAADAIRLVKSVTDTAPTYEVWLYSVHNDHLGTPQAMSDQSGALIWRTLYAPFGQASVDEDPDGDGTVVGLNIVFPGQYFDKESGLHYNYFRYYDPDTGRYLTSDPIGLAGGLNTYAYVNNAPTNAIDPYGLDCVAVNGSVTCTVPGGGPTVTFPRPEGWPDVINSNSSNYHFYNIPIPLNGADPSCVQQGIINNPTPGSPSPATQQGTLNNATPTNAQNVFDGIDWVSSFGNDPGGYNNSPVRSYTRNNGSVVVNVTLPGHPLHPGYVARTVNGSQVNNFGEGTGFLQGPYSPVAGQINGVWNNQTQGIVNNCGCD